MDNNKKIFEANLRAAARELVSRDERRKKAVTYGHGFVTKEGLSERQRRNRGHHAIFRIRCKSRKTHG